MESRGKMCSVVSNQEGTQTIIQPGANTTTNMHNMGSSGSQHNVCGLIESYFWRKDVGADCAHDVAVRDKDMLSETSCPARAAFTEAEDFSHSIYS